MTDDILVCENRPVATLSGDQIPALGDGTVPLRDAEGNQIGTVRIDGEAIVATMYRTDRTGSATISIGDKVGNAIVVPRRKDNP